VRDYKDVLVVHEYEVSKNRHDAFDCKCVNISINELIQNQYVASQAVSDSHEVTKSEACRYHYALALTGAEVVIFTCATFCQELIFHVSIKHDSVFRSKLSQVHFYLVVEQANQVFDDELAQCVL